MLPEIVEQLFAKHGERPKTQSGFDEARKLISEQGLDLDFYNREIFLTQDDVAKMLNNLTILKESAFYDFFVRDYGLPKGKGDELDAISSIVANDYWSDEYPDIGVRFLQLSSIEGEGSYFYDKETDVVYDVDWGDEEDMVNGNLKPSFSSFYDFLEWYYS